MHLMYFRFFTKAMRDLGLIDFGAPAVNLYNQGIFLRNLSIDYKEFGPAPTTPELLSMMHDTDMESVLPLIQKNLEQQRLADELKDPTASPSP